MTHSPPGVVPYGFDGPEDYIEKITYDIWNLPQRNPELIRKYYSPQTAIHLDGGDLVGDEIVIANTLARLRSYPDFHGVIDDTIWTGSEDEGYRTSMRWTWTGTDTGGTGFGPATRRPVTFMAIANCVVEGEVITEEWLGANPLSQARQLGFSTEQAIKATAYPAKAKVTRPGFSFRATAEGDLVIDAFTKLLGARHDTALFSQECRSSFAPDRERTGTAPAAEWARGFRGALGLTAVDVDDQYSRPAEGGKPLRVATQWRLRGTGPKGPVEFLLVSHHHLAKGQVTAQWLAYDELALAHQGIFLPNSYIAA